MCSVSAGHPNMGGPMRMNPPRGMAMGPQVRAPTLKSPGALRMLCFIEFYWSECAFKTIRNISHKPLTSCFIELRRNEASTQLHGRSNARNEHVSETFHTSVEMQLPCWVNLLFKSLLFFFLRGPGGRGPWPGPNTNSVSRSF